MDAILQLTVLFVVFSAVFCNEIRNKYDNTTLTLHSDQVTWLTAANACDDQDSAFLNISDIDANGIALIKRAAEFGLNSSGWIGSYVTYELDLSRDSNVNIRTELCLAMRFKLVLTNENSFYYAYDILATNCSHKLHAACNRSGSNEIFFSITNTTRLNACSQNEILWSPPMTRYPIAQSMSIAFGNFSGNKNIGHLLGNTFWIEERISTSIAHLPVEGNILQCGYIASHKNGIVYDNCYQNRSFICETASQEQDKALAPESLTSSKVGLYTGASLGSIACIAICVFAVVVYMRKRNKRIQDSNDDDKLPKGGKSFTRPMVSNLEEDGINNRISTYNKIDVNHFENKSSNGSSRFENLSQQSAHSVDSSVEFVYAMYDPAKKKGRSAESSTVPPKAFSPHPGYLTMDGNRHGDSDYDVLKVTGSTKNGIHARKITMDTDDNVYGMTMSDEQESVYDTTTFTRNLSQKALVNNDYDHVTVKNDPEMNSSICNSINASGSSKRPVPLPRSNPGYEKGEIIK